MRLSVLAAVCAADRPQDLVTSLPGFENVSWSFKAYSGILDVPGPINGYDALRIHYQFHTSQKSQADPVVTWHQGGPGGSSVTVGLYGEMGAFRIGEQGNYINEWAWNKVANMLYLESPAGSGDRSGYSSCWKGGKAVDCDWNDTTQAEAYAHSLAAFFKAFPEFVANDLYLTGESYFGQYGPNIAHYIVNTAPFSKSLNLKGIALGNACWGGTSTCVACNGPSEDKIDVDLFFGKGLYSPKLHKNITKACKFPDQYQSCGGDNPGPFCCSEPGHAALSSECKQLLAEMDRQVGPHNVYNIYDNCGNTQDFLTRTGKTSGWLRRFLRSSIHDPASARAELTRMNGGFQWDCLGDADSWITRADVRKALHLDQVTPGASGFSYASTGPASVTLYPELAQKLNVLIYNGDADACVPYNGNEKWIDELEAAGNLTQTSAWSPWYNSNHATPAGYETAYKAPNGEHSFSFMTIRLAGHMAPQYQPESSFVMFRQFVNPAKESELVV
mmetsp:Transcript_13239/g.29964  ORF Transcript_13239/g.29964 Transcript_13239/m.29964 type:complete len:502 (-) Transcript_13239:72-1577(-)